MKYLFCFICNLSALGSFHCSLACILSLIYRVAVSVSVVKGFYDVLMSFCSLSLSDLQDKRIKMYIYIYNSNCEC